MGVQLHEEDAISLESTKVFNSSKDAQYTKPKKINSVANFWKDTPLFVFPIDIKAVIAHLTQDMRDDWFPDPLKFLDLIEKTNDIHSIVNTLLEENNGIYHASICNICDVPKKGLGIRYALETDFYDRLVYQAICSYLMPYFDQLLSHRILGHRYNKNRKEEKYIFKPRIELWKVYEGVTFTAFKNNQALLCTDIFNYFENISIENIRISFESKISTLKVEGHEKYKIRSAIDMLCKLLTKWTYNGSNGLPQNRDPSSFIANVILDSVDKAMIEKGYDYYRYVDDIRIICSDEHGAQKALMDLIEELRKVGMNINSAKTKILTNESTDQEISDFFPGTDDRSNTIDNMWKSRSRRVISRSAKYIAEIISDCIEKEETQSRQFRFAVNRLKILVDANLFDIHSELSNNLVLMMLNALHKHPASTDQFCRLILALQLNNESLIQISDFLCNRNKALHRWQNYHLWNVLASKKFKSEILLNSALEIIVSDPTSSEASAIFLYLYQVGECHRLKSVVSLFEKNWPLRNQRYFLLATRKFDRPELSPIISELGIRVQGTAHRAAKYFDTDGNIVLPPTNTNIENLYDEISPYD
ncbi:RNA-directed DNA polymerase [Acinetobacter baumannii]